MVLEYCEICEETFFTQITYDEHMKKHPNYTENIIDEAIEKETLADNEKNNELVEAFDDLGFDVKDTIVLERLKFIQEKFGIEFAGELAVEYVDFTFKRVRSPLVGLDEVDAFFEFLKERRKAKKDETDEVSNFFFKLKIFFI